MTYTLVSRGVCAHCLGSAVCYNCGGLTSCDECADGQCPACVDGKETWLMFDQDGKRLGSCLTRRESRDWVISGTLPSWWAGYYGATE